MSENNISLIDIFSQQEFTLQEAEEKRKKELGAPKVERFRIGEDGEYIVRVLPLAPVLDENGQPMKMERRGYEYPIYQQFLNINIPTQTGKKPKKITVPVIKATQKGVDKSVDLIETYVTIAKEKYSDDADFMKRIESNSFSGGLRYDYQHVAYVFDLTDGKSRKGPYLWQMSNPMYKGIEELKVNTWKRDAARLGGVIRCPLTSITATPLVITRTTKGKTDYKYGFDRITDTLKEEELKTLLDLPRIPDIIYRITRYQVEATIEFLKQYDELNDVDVCSEQDFKDACDKLLDEIPSDDNSHFSIVDKDDDNKKEEITLDSLYARHDANNAAGNGEGSEEYKQLRLEIQQYVNEKGYDIRLSHSKNNQTLLEEIDEIENGEQRDEEVEEEKPVQEAPVEKPARRSRPSRPVVAAPEPEPEKDEDDELPFDDTSKEKQPEEAQPEDEIPMPTPTRTRRRR